MRILLKSNYTWKYCINLTGQEFPLKTNFEIAKILQKINAANDIESTDEHTNHYTIDEVCYNNVS
jgi:hypothetical protein